MTSAGNKLFTVFGGGSLPYLLNQNLLLASQYAPGGWLYDSHSRASGATVVDENGNVVWANENLWFPRENLNSIHWAEVRSSAQEDTEIALPSGLGLTTASKLIEDSTVASNHRLDDAVTPVDSDQYLTVSGIFRGDGNRQAAAFGFTHSAFYDAKFHLQSGTYEGKGTVVDQGMISLGGGWWRCWATFNPQPGKTRLYIWMGKGDGGSLDDSEFSYDGDGSSFIHLTGMQFQRGQVLGDLLLNSDALERTFTPRLQHDKDGNPLGYLHEPQATNEVGYSEDYVSERGQLVGMSIVEDQTQDDPMGGTKATTFRASAGLSRYWTGQPFSVAAAGEVWTISRFVKKEASGCPRAVVGFGANGFASGRKALFDPSDGTLIDDDGVTGTHVEEFPDFWRFSVTATSSGSSGSASVAMGLVPSTVTDVNVQGITVGTEELTFFGDQRETGTAPTSYIPTTGAAATRQADTAEIDVPADSDGFAYVTYGDGGETTFAVTPGGTWTIPTDLDDTYSRIIFKR